MKRKSMTKTLKTIIVTLFFIGFIKTSAAQEEKWIFLPPTNLFKPLLADLREPAIGLTASNNLTRYDLSLGGSLDLIQWKPSGGNLWAMGILGACYLNIIRYDWASYRLEDGDSWYGFYASQSSGNFTNRLEFRHGSSHLGDTLFGNQTLSFYGQTFVDQTAIPYERDLIQFTDAYQPCDSFRIYGGLGYWLDAVPSIQPFFVHLGTELFSPCFNLGVSFLCGYFAYDLKIGDQSGGIADQNFQLGVRYKLSAKNQSFLRLALTYYNGVNEFGQFYQQNDTHWGLGLFLDP